MSEHTCSFLFDQFVFFVRGRGHTLWGGSLKTRIKNTWPAKKNKIKVVDYWRLGWLVSLIAVRMQPGVLRRVSARSSYCVLAVAMLVNAPVPAALSPPLTHLSLSRDDNICSRPRGRTCLLAGCHLYQLAASAVSMSAAPGAGAEH